MDAELAPFLSGEALIFDMRVVNPKVKLRLLKDGTLDWTRGSQPEIPARTVVLENVHVSGGDVRVHRRSVGTVAAYDGAECRNVGEVACRSMAHRGRCALWTANMAASPSPAISRTRAACCAMRTRLQPDKHPVTVDLDGELKLVDSKPNYQGTVFGGDREP